MCFIHKFYTGVTILASKTLLMQQISAIGFSPNIPTSQDRKSPIPVGFRTPQMAVRPLPLLCSCTIALYDTASYNTPCNTVIVRAQYCSAKQVIVSSLLAEARTALLYVLPMNAAAVASLHDILQKFPNSVLGLQFSSIAIFSEYK